MSILKGFISYSTRDRHTAAEVKEALEEAGLSVFMAHDDIQISQEWRNRILDELRTMDVFVPLLSASFRASDWASQEIGVAIAREVPVLPVSLDGTIPYGFISAYQSREFRSPIGRDFFLEAIVRCYPRQMISMLIDTLEESGGWRIAEANFRPLLPHLDQLTPAEAERIAIASTKNSEIWDAGRCRADYLPLFIQKNHHQLRSEILLPLQYQIEERAWYSEKGE